MPPTLASLVQHSALRLSVLTGQARLDTPVRWAHASELADPTPYLEGGELLLVTALKLDAEDPESMRGYVRRLADKGVVGPGLRRGRALREGAGRTRRGVPRGRAAAARSAAPYALHRHQQGRLRGHRRRAVPRGHGGLRGPAGDDAGRALPGGTRGAAHQTRLGGGGLGRAVRRVGGDGGHSADVGGAPCRPVRRRRRTAA